MKRALLLTAHFLVACSTIPVIRFSNDAGSDDAVAPMDASDDSPAVDGGIDTGSDSPSAADGGGCPGTVPPGALVCCGPIPCGTQFCSMSACMDCENKCAVGTLCCPNNGGKATCLLDASTCP